jgi:hypothetical protein
MKSGPLSPDTVIVDICRDRAFKATFTVDSPASQGAIRSLISANIDRKVETLRFEYYLVRFHGGQAIQGDRDYRKPAPAWQINFVSERKPGPRPGGDAPF